MVVVGLGESSFGDRLEEETRRAGSPRGDDMGSLGEKLATQMAKHLHQTDVLGFETVGAAVMLMSEW